MLNLIKEFSKIRKSARAYFCYLLNRMIPNRLNNIKSEVIINRLEMLIKENEFIDIAYLLDKNGDLIKGDITTKKLPKMSNYNRANKSYFYQATKEKRCILTEPYPSNITGRLTVSASLPVYNDKGELLYVVVIDISINKVIELVHLQKGDQYFRNFSKFIKVYCSM